MGKITVVAEVDGNSYDINSISENSYERTVAAPMQSGDVLVTASDEANNESTEIVKLNVIGEWSPPKTDWSAKWTREIYAGDYFTYLDYNRIKDNLLFLSGYASQMYQMPVIDMGEAKVEADLIYADEVNLFETTLAEINSSTFSFSEQFKTWKENKLVPTYEDWNRIESLQLKIYNTLVAQRKAQNRLAFTLGGQKGFKV